MKKGKFFIFLLLLVLLATGYFFYSTDRTGDTVLIGIVDANQVIVSSKIAGRVEKLNVDEGSQGESRRPHRRNRFRRTGSAEDCCRSNHQRLQHAGVFAEGH